MCFGPGMLPTFLDALGKKLDKTDEIYATRLNHEERESHFQQYIFLLTCNWAKSNHQLKE